MPSPTPEPLLTADDVASILRVNRRAVYDLVHRHGLPALRVGGRHFRFSAKAIQAWVDEQQAAEVAYWSRVAAPFRRTG
jgi:excisionase family DNA binding protein